MMPINLGKKTSLHVVDQRGIALLTVMMLLIIMTILGMAAITMTGFENKIAGFGMRGAVAATAADACLDTAVQIIEQTLAAGLLPAVFSPDPVPATNSATLNQEILGQKDNDPDTQAAVPNTVMSLNNYTVNGDIDRLYIEPKAGASIAFDEANAGSLDIIYRVTCVSSNAATGASRQIDGVYACTWNPDGCQKAI